jgi:NAD(P)-dependent dehydrogenase (short-subunit alcohol dehydrogenase family)
MDAVVHNAGVWSGRHVLPVNVVAPYLLTALIDRPRRLIYLSSGMHRGASGNLDDIDWTARRWNAGAAYSESKLHVSALSASVARHWPDVLSNSVDPGWVPTKMGGPSAPDDFALGGETQAWLAVSNDPAALVSGKYWHHRQPRQPAPPVTDTTFQDRLTDTLAGLTGITLF